MDLFPYIAANSPTINEIRAMNRDTLALWPLSMLLAICDCGIDLDRRQDATVCMVFLIDDEVVDLQYNIVDRGKVIGRIAEVSDDEFVATWKLRVSDFESAGT